MNRIIVSAIAALLAFDCSAANAQLTQPARSPQHAATKQDRSDALAAARASTDLPNAIAADLLEGGYAEPADKRYRQLLVTASGAPVKVGGQLVFSTFPPTPDDRRAALYLELLRMIGKANVPMSAAKIARAQVKATQKLVALETARASGQPVTTKAERARATAATAAAAASGENGANGENGMTLLHVYAPIILPPLSGGAFAVQSIDGVPMMTNVPAGTFIGTLFNADDVDVRDNGACAAGAGSKGADDREAILRCFAHAVHNLRVQAAEDAVTEYQKWKSDPYGFVPPSGFTYSAPARPVTNGSGRTLSVAGLYSTDASAAPDVRQFGEADAVDAFLGGADGRALGKALFARLQTSNATDMPLIRAAIGDPPTPDPMKQISDLADGTAVIDKIKSLLGTQPAQIAAIDATGGVAGAGIMSSETAYDAVLPYASRGFFTPAEEGAAEGGVEEGTFEGGVTAAEAESGPIGLLAAFVTTMVQAGVDEGKKVFGNRSLPGDLQNELAAAKAAPDPTAAQLAGSQSGRTELFTVFVGGVKHIAF